MNINPLKVTRFEVIDDTGRVYSNSPCKISLYCQDDGRTLKVFVTQNKKPIKTKE